MLHAPNATLKTLILVVVMAVCLAGRSLLAATALVDEGRFFDDRTKEQVESIAGQIKEKFGKDLIVRTYASLPRERAAQIGTIGRAAVFHDWVIAEARAARANGVVILICRNPAHLEVTAGNKTKARAFTQSDQDELRDVLLAKFKAKDFDAGIIDAAKFVLDRMEKNLGEAPLPPPVIESPAPANQPPPVSPPPVSTATGSAATAPATQPVAATRPAPATQPAGETDTSF